jgi:3-methyladenine DNA glycosylase AlkD
MEPRAIADEIESRLRAAGTAKRAIGEKAYLKSDLEFTGTLVSETRAVVRRIDAELGPDHDPLIELVEALWSKPVFERRLAAIMFLQRHPRLLSVADVPLVERLVRESGTWALVDYLATDVLGRMVEADPDPMTRVMDRWATDADFWIRRSSLLCELRPIRHGAGLDRFLARAEPMLEEREFFIRKAIGWVLREAGKRRPEEVTAWLEPRTHRASGVTMREALKYLPPADRDRLSHTRDATRRTSSNRSMPAAP